jgi:hypothetical protein
MTTYSVAVHRLLQEQHHPEIAICDAFHGIFAGNMRKDVGDHAAPIDGAITGGDIAAVSPANDHMPDQPVVSVWPGKTLP